MTNDTVVVLLYRLMGYLSRKKKKGRMFLNMLWVWLKKQVLEMLMDIY